MTAPASPAPAPGEGRVEAQRLDLIERLAVTRMLAFMVARAVWRLRDVPFWQFRKRVQMRATIAALAGLLRDVEEGAQHDRQAAWMVDIEGGASIDRAIADVMAVVDEIRP